MEMSRMEHILRYALGEVSTLPPNLSRIENLLIELIEAIPSTITVDDALSDSSENPVQNKVLNSIINGTGSGSVYSKIMLAIAEVVADAPQDFDTLKEISDWISSHEDSAAAMNSAIQANTTAITGKVDKISGKGLSTEDYTTAEKTKLAGLSNYDDTALQTTVANKVDKITGKGLSTEDYTTSEKTKLAGLQNYDDTYILAALDNKVNKVSGKGLSTNDFTDDLLSKLGVLTLTSVLQGQSNNTPKSYTYTMSMSDFGSAYNGLGIYLLFFVTWSTTPSISIYAVAYSGGSLDNVTTLKIAGEDKTITVSDGVISFSAPGLVRIIALS